MKILVKGHSGCHIEIKNSGTNLYIYKSTFDSQYVSRLYKQAIKQQNASKNIYQYIRIPEIYNIEKSNEHLIIQMEYVYSKNFVDYFEDAGFDNISYFIKALKIFIDSEIKESPNKIVNTDIIKTKFDDVCKKCHENIYINSDKEIDQILEMSKTAFYTLPSQIEIPIGHSHGDLTFSNILFNGNNYYLIDFLDSFIESPLLDLVKIRQDSKYEWSKLMYEGNIDSTRLNIISTKIDKEIDTYYAKYDWYNKYYSIFQLMNFLRILQYAKEKKVINYLKCVLKNML